MQDLDPSAPSPSTPKDDGSASQGQARTITASRLPSLRRAVTVESKKDELPSKDGVPEAIAPEISAVMELVDWQEEPYDPTDWASVPADAASSTLSGASPAKPTEEASQATSAESTAVPAMQEPRQSDEPLTQILVAELVQEVLAKAKITQAGAEHRGQSETSSSLASSLAASPASGPASASATPQAAPSGVAAMLADGRKKWLPYAAGAGLLMLAFILMRSNSSDAPELAPEQAVAMAGAPALGAEADSPVASSAKAEAKPAMAPPAAVDAAQPAVESDTTSTTEAGAFAEEDTASQADSPSELAATDDLADEAQDDADADEVAAQPETDEASAAETADAPKSKSKKARAGRRSKRRNQPEEAAAPPPPAPPPPAPPKKTEPEYRRLLSEARSSSGKKAYDLASASNKLKASDAALTRMTIAACQMKRADLAKDAFRKLPLMSKSRTSARDACKKSDIRLGMGL